jgi:uncharacterized membrane protein
MRAGDLVVVPAIGLACLGAVISYLCMFFVARLKTHTVSALSAVVVILLGGVVGKFLTTNTPAKDAIWWYPIGMAIGLVVWIGIRFAGPTGLITAFMNDKLNLHL